MFVWCRDPDLASVGIQLSIEIEHVGVKGAKKSTDICLTPAQVRKLTRWLLVQAHKHG